MGANGGIGKKKSPFIQEATVDFPCVTKVTRHVVISVISHGSWDSRAVVTYG